MESCVNLKQDVGFVSGVNYCNLQAILAALVMDGLTHHAK